MSDQIVATPDDGPTPDVKATEPVVDTSKTVAPDATTVADKATPADKPVIDWMTTEIDFAALQKRIAKDDAKKLSKISRYDSIESMADALIAAQDKIRSGGVRTVLPKDATPEQVTAWREENGIPKAPDEYMSGLKDGLVPGEQDKPILDTFLKRMHDKNAPPELVKEAIEFFYEDRDRQMAEMKEAMAAQDEEYRVENTVALRQEFGEKTQAQINAMNNLLSTAPPEVAEAFAQARMPDGNVLGNCAGMIKWLAEMSKEMNPTATIIPKNGASISETVKSEKDMIQAAMADYPNGEYYTNEAKRAQMQKRYEELVVVESKQR